MQGDSRARIAAWLFRLVFYGGSLTLIGLYFLGNSEGGATAPVTILSGRIDGGARIAVRVDRDRVIGWQSQVRRVDCDRGPDYWFGGKADAGELARPSRRRFVALQRRRDPTGSWTTRAFSSGTVSPSGDTARGVLRFRVTYARPRGGRATCDSGLLPWRAARQP